MSKNEPKKERISLRVTKAEKELLKRKLEKGKISKFIYTRIQPHFRALKKDKPATGYECFECGKKIKLSQQYYCELANLEKFTESKKNHLELEIEVKDSLPTKILCKKCAEKNKKLKQFENGEKETRVKGSERTIE